jgi:competence protein ComEC
VDDSHQDAPAGKWYDARKFQDGTTREEFRMAKRTPGSLYLLAFSIGAIGHRFLDELLPVWLTIAVLAVCTLFASRVKPVRLVVALLSGLAWTNLVASGVSHTTIDKNLEKQDVVVSGRILGVPLSTAHSARFDFNVDSLSYAGKHYQSPGKIRLKAYHNTDIFKANQAWRFTVRLKQARSYQNPGSRFNYETYLFENRIRATGYVRNEPTNRLIAEDYRDYSVSEFRESIVEFIDKHLGDDPRHGILTALIVGIRGAMSDADWLVLRNTGTIHLVAISGLHIGLVSGLVMWLAARVWRLTGQLQTRVTALNAAVVVGLGAGGCYALLAGMTIPTRRAVVMLSVVAISILLKRMPAPFELLALALAVVLVMDPLTPLATGFWLSFGAVAVIVCSVAKRRDDAGAASRAPWRGKARGWVSIQLGLSFGLAPLLLLMFNQLSIIAPLANLIAIPVIGFVAVPVALVGLCLFALGLPGWSLVVFKAVLFVLEQLWRILKFMANTDWAIWQPPSAPIWILLPAAVGTMLLFFRPAFPARFTAVAWFLPLLFFQPSRPEHGEFQYTMLDVGHGLASVVETRTRTLVFDTGPRFEGGLDAGKTVVVPYLKSRGIRNIDTLVISHEHMDHSGGFQAIRNEMEIDRLLSGVPAEFTSSHLPAEQCRQGQKWLWDGVQFEILWPLNGKSENRFQSGNNASCVLKISSGYGSLLLTADIEKEAEKRLVADYPEKLSSDVLQVPHQGSKTSSTARFLAAVDPASAVVSTGYLNRFGHPHDVVSNRYASRNLPLTNTAYTGAVSILFARKPRQVNHRDTLTGYWFSRD